MSYYFADGGRYALFEIADQSGGQSYRAVINAEVTPYASAVTSSTQINLMAFLGPPYFQYWYGVQARSPFFYEQQYAQGLTQPLWSNVGRAEVAYNRPFKDGQILADLSGIDLSGPTLPFMIAFPPDAWDFRWQLQMTFVIDMVLLLSNLDLCPA